ncbi:MULTISPECIES: hypothetical protein [Zunongwangia]|jgi:hypothetical protein|uniref:Uncharacterized protein n=2 Tax=Zunongwangia profunda TaxID=398743 RepID=D5BKZ5_ZUNPS|nr:hypothetical protein [Zunongwangia profunda]ADF51894.1 conserved hypothetical protein [Zunongwangia profunda SM-A87]MAS73064.1 hypothetical protein [Zunongwangia sp.]MCC4227890.1 hypothetical protein [Zunongwangia profunda]HCV80002.1 hypothetical protein [Zunongwangia profunda]|tara:strand:- start:336 stop:584 length:249 start_codon:yes stop_codon:yes gene_type:complete
MKKIYLTFILVTFLIYEGYSQEYVDSETKRTVINNGIGLGSVIAGVTSWERNKSVLLATIHGFFSWFYVIYFVLTRKKEERK